MAERIIARLQLPMTADAFVTVADALTNAYGPELLCRGNANDETIVELFLENGETPEDP